MDFRRSVIPLPLLQKLLHMLIFFCMEKACLLQFLVGGLKICCKLLRRMLTEHAPS